MDALSPKCCLLGLRELPLNGVLSTCFGHDQQPQTSTHWSLHLQKTRILQILSFFRSNINTWDILTFVITYFDSSNLLKFFVLSEILLIFHGYDTLLKTICLCSTFVTCQVLCNNEFCSSWLIGWNSYSSHFHCLYYANHCVLKRFKMSVFTRENSATLAISTPYCIPEKKARPLSQNWFPPCYHSILCSFCVNAHILVIYWSESKMSVKVHFTLWKRGWGWCNSCCCHNKLPCSMEYSHDPWVGPRQSQANQE